MSQGIRYTVDMVLCIDATGSMNPVLKNVKAGALRFHEDLRKLMEEKNKAIDELRVRVIAYRDYYADGSSAIKMSDFFKLPEQRENFSAFVSEIRADGGGDEPENGLEALAFAIRSDWNRTGDKRRQVIVVWTDASAHALEKAAGMPSGLIPQDLPKNFDEMTDLWDGQTHMSHNGKRLILFTPDAEPWTNIATHWENTVHYPAKAGEGLSDKDYQELLSAIANSI